MKFSLKNKFALLLLSATAFLSAVLIIISTNINRDNIDTMYKAQTENTARIAAATMDLGDFTVLRDRVVDIYEATEEKVTSSEWGSERFDKYVSAFHEVYDMPEYARVFERLREVQDNSGVGCIYVLFPDLENMNYIYVIDADKGEPCPVGCIDSYDWAADIGDSLKIHPERGINAYITDTEEYGRLVSTMMPITNEKNEVLAYACADLAMDTIVRAQNISTLILVFISLISFILVYLILINLVNRSIVKPIRELSDTAEHYWDNGEAHVRSNFSYIKVKTNDEIKVLTESMQKMENDINSYFITLDATKQELTAAREETEGMKQLATKDALTGIRNKTAYDAEVKNLQYGVDSGLIDSYGIAMIDLNFLKKINDNYGHDKGNIAIKKVCQTVCGVFAHSPVFRVGGDEFVVILMNQDLKDLDVLVYKFKDLIKDIYNDESLEQWERISASIGYAIYDPSVDKNVENVFKRADDAMYKNKKEMKAVRTE